MLLLLLLSAALPRHAAAMFQGDGKREYVHRVYKVKITEDHLTRDFHLEKRAKNQCSTDYNLCPSSLGGGCCPNNYACAKESCYATTAAVSTCAGHTGYYACPFDSGGGCCPQGLLCGANEACTPPAGATYSQTCPGTGYTACPASLGGGCCQSDMACGTAACYNTSPSTTVIVVATTQDGSATTITSTSVFTPTGDSADSNTGVVPKVFPSTYPKQAATEDDNSSGGGGSSGLSKGAIGGIVGGAAAVLVIFLAVAYFLVKRLNKTKRAVESRRETTSGSGTRQTAEKKSATQVSIVRMQPTPSEVDAMDCDPLMVPSSSIASPRGQNQGPRPGNGRSRSGSDTLSQPSGYSSSAAGPRWNTPSVDSDGGDRNSREYFSLPPRVHNQLGGRRASEVSSQYSQYSYHRFIHGGRHGRNHSNASELSAGSDSELGSQHGLGSPLIGATAAELSNEGGFVPELPGSDTETESNGPHGANGRRPAQPRRRSTGVVSPISTTSVNKPPLTHATLARRRGNSAVSPMDGQNGSGGRGRSDSSAATESRLGSIDESAAAVVPATNSMHGYFGSPMTAVGQTAAGRSDDLDTPPLPGFVSLGHPLSGNQTDQGQSGR
ncbi:hypothetical protein F5883DRAFT_517474 [Diaporthe sp. PMI_573]|nr:hypothetical protein F5883DRAFT_517474 [Diaporthaceae sp. PMI_573]